MGSIATMCAEDRHLIPLLSVPANVFDQFEIYDHVWRIEHFERELDASRNAHQETRIALDATEVALADARLEQVAAHSTIRHLQDKLEAVQSELAAAQDRLAPFGDLGPIAIEAARGLRRCQSTPLALQPSPSGSFAEFNLIPAPSFLMPDRLGSPSRMFPCDGI